MSWCPTEAKTQPLAWKLNCWNMLQGKRGQPNIRLEYSGTICRALRSRLPLRLTEAKKTESHWDFRGLLLMQDKSLSRFCLKECGSAGLESILNEYIAWTGSQLDHQEILCWEGGCCSDRRQNRGGWRCPVPVLASNNQGAPLAAGIAPLHFIWLRKLPLLSFFHFHFSLPSMKNLLRQDACAVSLCLHHRLKLLQLHNHLFRKEESVSALEFWAPNLWFSPELHIYPS